MKITVEDAQTEADQEICLALRAEVFLVEQSVPLADELDGLDEDAAHLLARLDGVPAGTLRLRKVDDAAKIERVCVAKALRGKGVADALTVEALEKILTWPGIAKVRLSAQTEVIPFYERHGFVAFGEVYDDAGIPHRDMSLTLSSIIVEDL